MSNTEKVWSAIIPAPPNAERPNFRHRIFGEPQGNWEYKNANGNTLCFVSRYTNLKGEKVYNPTTYGNLDGKIGWHNNGIPESRPLYNLPGLAKNTEKTVLVVEGEKATEAATKLFPELVVTTPMNGAKSAHKTDFGPLANRRIVVWRDNDEAGKRFEEVVSNRLRDIKAKEIRVVSIPEDFPNKWDLADEIPAEWNLSMLRELIDKASLVPNRDSDEAVEKQKVERPDPSSGLYVVKNNSIIHNKFTQNGLIETPLCNFVMRIICEETYDDGVEIKKFLVLEGMFSDGTPIRPFRVLSSQFSSLNFIVSDCGSRAIVYAGFSNKDHLRTAIQVLSNGNATYKTTYGHTGWRKINGDYVYLFSGGGIGKNGRVTDIHVALDEGKLSSFQLPAPPSGEELSSAIRRALSFLDLAPLWITAPLFCASFLAPLTEILVIDFSIFLVGPTGNFKSELTAIIQAFYGAGFNRKNLPGSWSSTANALEAQASKAKDAIFTIDDFKPGGTPGQISSMHEKADRVFRAQGNHSGRDRLTSEGKLKTPYSPRGLTLASGEDIPRGHSIRARLGVLEISPGQVDVKKLSQLQSVAEDGILSKTMAGYIQWLAPQLENLKTVLRARQKELRDQFTVQTAHRKTADLTGMLTVGLELFLRFALESQAISEEEKVQHESACLKAITQMALAQGEHQESEDSALRFLQIVGSAFTSGRAHCVDSKTGMKPENPDLWGWQPRGEALFVGSDEPKASDWMPRGDKIGWIDGGELLLEPDAAYAVVQRIASEQTDPLPVQKQTIIKRLAEKGYIVRDEGEGKNTLKRTVRGEQRRPRVLVFPDKNIVFTLSKAGAAGAEGTNGKSYHLHIDPHAPAAPVISEQGINKYPNSEVEFARQNQAGLS